MEYHVDGHGEFILDENGDPIEAYICICAAFNKFECACGAWDVPMPLEEDEDA